MVCRREGIASAKKSPASEEAGYRFQVSGFRFQVLLFAFASLLFLTLCLLLAPRPRTRQAGMPVLRFFFTLPSSPLGVCSPRSPHVVPASPGHSGGNTNSGRVPARRRRGLRRRQAALRPVPLRDELAR